MNEPNQSRPSEQSSEINDLFRSHLILVQTHQQLIAAASRRGELSSIQTPAQAPVYPTDHGILEGTPAELRAGLAALTPAAGAQPSELISSTAPQSGGSSEKQISVPVLADGARTTPSESAPSPSRETSRRGIGWLAGVFLALAAFTLFLVLRPGRTAESAVIRDRILETEKVRTELKAIQNELKNTQDALLANQRALTDAQKVITEKEAAVREADTIRIGQQARVSDELKLTDQAPSAELEVKNTEASTKEEPSVLSKRKENSSDLNVDGEALNQKKEGSASSNSVTLIEPVARGNNVSSKIGSEELIVNPPPSAFDQYREMERSVYQLETDLRHNLREFRDTGRALAETSLAIAQAETRLAVKPGTVAKDEHTLNDFLLPAVKELVSDQSLSEEDREFIPSALTRDSDLVALMRESARKLTMGQSRLLKVQSEIRDTQNRLRAAQAKLALLNQ